MGIKHSLKTKMKKALAFIALFGLVVQIAGPVLLYPEIAHAGLPTFATVIAEPFRQMIDAVKYAIQIAGDVMFKNALRTFTAKIAYDTAVWIGSGGKGQKPLFVTKPGRYLADAADSAAGDFLDQLSTAAWGESLCDIAPELKFSIYESIKIQYGLDVHTCD